MVGSLVSNGARVPVPEEEEEKIDSVLESPSTDGGRVKSLDVDDERVYLL